MRNLLIFILSACLCSCSESTNTSGLQDITIADLLILSVPNESVVTPADGIDSYVMFIIQKTDDSLQLEYGPKGIINSLYSDGPGISHLSEKVVLEKNGWHPSPDQVMFSESPELDRKQNIFDKNFYFYDTINNIVAKIVQPKIIGDGITGIYISSLKDGKSLSIFGTNLDSVSHMKALKIYRSIRYM